LNLFDFLPRFFSFRLTNATKIKKAAQKIFFYLFLLEKWKKENYSYCTSPTN